MQKPEILLAQTEAMKAWYIDAIENAGGVATLYCDKDAVTSFEKFDGLILGGGVDVSPARYGEEINGSVNIDLDRDEREFFAAEEFLKAGKPIFGICRGFQLLNVLFGGSLIQHLENTDEHRKEGEDKIHDVVATSGSIMEKLYGKEIFGVASVHHQAVKKLGEGLILTSEKDGVAEAFEHKNLPVFGVQFHPERMCCTKKREDAVDGIELFKYFIDLCKGMK